VVEVLIHWERITFSRLPGFEPQTVWTNVVISFYWPTGTEWLLLT